MKACVELDRSDANRLRDEEIDRIVKRRKDIGVLQLLYTQRDIRAQYQEVVDRCREEKQYTKIYAKRLPENWRSSDNAVKFSPCQTKRFRDAVITIWMLNEASHLARVGNYETHQEQMDVRDILRLLCAGKLSPDRTLLQRVDVLEVYEFVWVFLVRKIIPTIEDAQLWAADNWQKYVPDDLWEFECDFAKWEEFLNQAALYFRPQDITKWVAMTANEKALARSPDFLQSRGALDSQGSVDEEPNEDLDLHFDVDESYSNLNLNALEDCGKITWHGIETLVENLPTVTSSEYSFEGRSPADIWVIFKELWAIFFDEYWPINGAGAHFEKHQSNDDLFESMSKYLQHLKEDHPDEYEDIMNWLSTKDRIENSSQ